MADQEGPVYTTDEYENLARDQQQIIDMVIGHGLYSNTTENALQHDQALSSTLGLLHPCEGCVPSAYVTDLEESIMQKFKMIYGVAAKIVSKILVPEGYYLRVIVEPSYRDASEIAVLMREYSPEEPGRAHCLLSEFRDTAMFQFGNLEDIAAEVERAQSMCAKELGRAQYRDEALRQAITSLSTTGSLSDEAMSSLDELAEESNWSTP